MILLLYIATDDKPNSSGEMDFKLLMKRGHKQMVKDLKVPLDSELAIGLKDTQMVMSDWLFDNK